MTNDYDFVRQFDPLSSDIYKDKQYYYLTYKEIAELRGIPASVVKERYLKAKRLLKNRDVAWMEGLSKRARVALVKHHYTNFKMLYDDIMGENVDLETLKGIGHKVAVEIRGWCVKTGHQ